MFLGIDVDVRGEGDRPRPAAGAMAAVVAQASAALPVSRPQPLWSEQDPDAWVAATKAAVLALPAAARAAVRGIGLAGQMHGATLLGADHRPLRPAILWNDGRSAAECRELEHAVPELHRITGNLAMPGFTAPKLLWVRAHELDVFDRVRTVLLPKDYLRLALTGERASDLSDSAGTLWLDVAARRWSDTLLAACGLTSAAMPRLLEGTQVSGRLRPEVSARWGMAAVPVGGRRRQRRGGGRRRRGARRRRAALARHVRRVLRRDRGVPPQPGRAGARLLSLPARLVAPDGGAPVSGGVRRLGGAGDRRRFPDAALRPRRGGRGGDGAGAVPALSLGRADAAQRCGGARRVARARRRHGRRPARRRGAGRGRLRPRRRARRAARGGNHARAGGRRRRRRTVALVGRIIAATLGVSLVYLRGGEVGPALGAARLAQLAVNGGEPGAVCAPPPVSHVVDPDPALAERLLPKRLAFRAAYPRITPLEKGA